MSEPLTTMGNGFQFIDIIFFAMIAAFLILRLRSVLGRRDGQEGRYDDQFKRKADKEQDADKTVVHLPDHRDTGNEQDSADADRPPSKVELSGDIIDVDPNFEPDEFITGARIAFELVLGAYASSDTATLESLVNSEVYNNFVKVIHDREQAGETLEDTLIGINVAEIVEAYMEGQTANITVKFVSEQINVTRNENGDIINGNSNLVTDVTDFWTFARDTQSSDPNWLLIATRSLD